MPSFESLAVTGPAPTPTPFSGGQADASGFEGLLERPAAGRLGIGRQLREQATAQAEAEIGPEVVTNPLNPLILPTVFGPQPETKSDQPLVNPGPGTETAKTTGPLINPGVTEAKTSGPLVNPGPGAQDDAGGAVPAPAPGIVPDALTAVSAQAAEVAVQAAVNAAGRAVSAVPQTAAPPAPELAEAEPTPGPALDLTADLNVEAAAPPPADATVQSAPATQTGAAASTSDRPVQAVEERTAAAADPAAANEADAGPAAQARAASEPQAAPAAQIRADIPAAQRMSFDAVTQISAQILRRLEGRSSRFDMELHPAEFGRVDVRLEIDAEGRLAARLAFDNPVAAADLRGRADELRRQLEQAGFQLSEDALSFSDRETQARERRDDNPSGDQRAFGRVFDADQADAEAQPAYRAMTRLGLDVRI